MLCQNTTSLKAEPPLPQTLHAYLTSPGFTWGPVKEVEPRPSNAATFPLTLGHASSWPNAHCPAPKLEDSPLFGVRSGTGICFLGRTTLYRLGFYVGGPSFHRPCSQRGRAVPLQHCLPKAPQTPANVLMLKHTNGPHLLQSDFLVSTIP